MTFGRPPRIPRAVADRAIYPRADGLIDDSNADEDRQEPRARFDFFIAYCKLHRILADVLEFFYVEETAEHSTSQHRASATLSPERLDVLFKIENELTNWKDSLDDKLKVPSTYIDSSKTRFLSRQANILHARYEIECSSQTLLP